MLNRIRAGASLVPYHTNMNKYLITKYVAICATVQADSATEAVKQFEDNLDGLYTQGKAYVRGLSIGDSGEPATVQKYSNPDTKGYRVLENVGSISAGDFIPNAREE